jgi:hypothetical protein
VSRAALAPVWAVPHGRELIADLTANNSLRAIQPANAAALDLRVLKLTTSNVILPPLHAASPYPEGPRYFARDWNLARSTIRPVRYSADRFQGFGEPLQLLCATPGLVRIYGYSCRSPYPEDRSLEDWLWERHKAFPAVCFSTVAPRGEFAFTPAAAVVEITRELLERELARLGVGSIHTRRELTAEG